MINSAVIHELDQHSSYTEESNHGRDYHMSTRTSTAVATSHSCLDDFDLRIENFIQRCALLMFSE